VSVQLTNGLLGVRRVDPDAVDAHGAPLPAVAGDPSELLPGKSTELDSGGWQLALDPSLWPVRVGDRIVSDDGREWLATSVKLITGPPLSAAEQALDLDLDISFVRVMGNQVTEAGVEPVDAALVGRTGSPV
jgi:hypothetical protein